MACPALWHARHAQGFLTRLATKQLGVASSLHDIGVSKKDGLLTLWHNRAVLATWPPRETRFPTWKDGAFGLSANNTSNVQLFRWSLSANRPGLPALAQLRRPVLVSFAGTFVRPPVRD